jgi:hypothetical protein
MLCAQQIVNMVAARLAAVPGWAAKVQTDRFWPFAESDVPAWRVTAEDEQSQLAEMSGAHRHTLEVAAAADMRAVQGMDTVMHDITATALQALFAPPLVAPFDRALFSYQLIGIDRTVETQNESATAKVRLRIEVQYHMHPADPHTFT